MPTTHTSYADLPAYITKDGSTIRELMHPALHASKHQSLAEAIIAPGATTLTHRHHLSEEIYHFTSGQGRMRLNESEFEVKAGDTVCIAPGTLHGLNNTGSGDLKVLCACAPAYSHEDTEICEEA